MSNSIDTPSLELRLEVCEGGFTVTYDERSWPNPRAALQSIAVDRRFRAARDTLGPALVERMVAQPDNASEITRMVRFLYASKAPLLRSKPIPALIDQFSPQAQKKIRQALGC